MDVALPVPASTRCHRFLGASTISSPSRLVHVVEGVLQKSGVVQSFKIVDPVLLVFGSHVLYSRDI